MLFGSLDRRDLKRLKFPFDVSTLSYFWETLISKVISLNWCMFTRNGFKEFKLVKEIDISFGHQENLVFVRFTILKRNLLLCTHKIHFGWMNSSHLSTFQAHSLYKSLKITTFIGPFYMPIPPLSKEKRHVVKKNHIWNGIWKRLARFQYRRNWPDQKWPNLKQKISIKSLKLQ